MAVQLRAIQLVLHVLQGSISLKGRIPAWMRAQTKALSITLTGVPARNATQSAAHAVALRLTTAILAKLEQLR